MSRRASLPAVILVAAAAAGGALAGGSGGSRVDVSRPAVRAPAGDAVVSARVPSRRSRAHHPRRPRRASPPVRVQIPAIGVDASLVPLGLDAQGALEAPKTFTGAGWWSGGARPGERGPAVIAGHVDTKTGPAVFFRLRDLRRGDAIIVTRRDGSRVRFAVQRSAGYPKTHFPSSAVYGPTKEPALRLITCSGTFDSSTGHYLDNTVVFAGGAT